MALWAAVTAAFTPFANVYLSKDLHLPMSQIGLIFFCGAGHSVVYDLADAVGLSPDGPGEWHRRNTGCHSAALACLAATQDRRLTIALYLSFSAVAMDERSRAVQRADEQSSGRGAQLGIGNDALLQRAAGVRRYGGRGDTVCSVWIPARAFGIAVLAITAAILFGTLVSQAGRRTPAQP
ncbi:MAG: hypothetical protein WDM87_17680 [Terracidiphilus sp.]